MSVAEQVEPVRVNQIAGERHDDFRRQRYARRLDSHQQNDARVAERRDRRNDEGGQGFDYSRDQADTPEEQRLGAREKKLERCLVWRFALFCESKRSPYSIPPPPLVRFPFPATPSGGERAGSARLDWSASKSSVMRATM